MIMRRYSRSEENTNIVTIKTILYTSLFAVGVHRLMKCRRVDHSDVVHGEASDLSHGRSPGP